MTKLMQSASALTLAAAIAAAPFVAQAQQQTETEAEQSAETVVQQTEEGAEAAGEAVEQAGQEAVQETQEAAGEAAEAVDQTSETVEAEVIVEGEEETAAEPATEEGALTEAPVGEVDGTIVMQDENSFLTSDLMGATIYNAAGEKVGDIDDAILSLDGMVEGVVIGVGGFLGIGEKHVAVEMQQISLQTDENGQPQLIIDTTKEALEAAPEFVSVEDQQTQAEAEAVPQTGTEAPAGGMLTSDPAPAGTTPPAPAGTAPAGEEQPADPTKN